jgi:hypothetical protein
VHYQLTDFDDSEMVALLRHGKEDLEKTLGAYSTDYKCVGFRAGHWNTQPSKRYLAALRGAGLRSDTSVFKWGFRADGGVAFDYRHAFSNVLAWYTCVDDVNQPTSEPTLLEVPIATELVKYTRMLTLRRLWLSLRFLREDREISAEISKVGGACPSARKRGSKLGNLFRYHPRKLDFCKLTAREMSSSISGLVNQFRDDPGRLPIPLVLIGHSKESWNPADLGRALAAIAKEHRGSLLFSSYREFVATYTVSAAAAARLERHDSHTLIA